MKIFDGTTVLTTFMCDVTTAWGEFNEQTIAEATIMLKAGDNVVLLKKASQSVEVDYIEIGERVGEYKAPNYNNEFGGSFDDDDSSDDGFQNADKGGCGSAAGSASAMAVMIIAGAVAVAKKRRND